MKTTPYKHQAEEFELSKDAAARAIFWEMGCGKTKLGIDTAWHLYEKGEINCLLVFAPNGVHRNWITDEVPAHGWSDDWDGMYWVSDRAGTKLAKEERERILEHDGLVIVAVNYDAARVKACEQFIRTLLAERKTMMILDESARIKNPSAQRTKKVMEYGSHANVKYKRVMTGTPVSNSPFDIYSQLMFIDPMIWRKHGIGKFMAFKRQYGVFEKKHFGNRAVQVVKAYRNLDHMHKVVDSCSSRLTKEQVLDLPSKIYTTYPVEMSKEQRRMYDKLRDEYMLELDNGVVVEATMAITRMLRLQQVLCGYTGSDREELHELESNPRLNALLDILSDVPHKCIVWARYQKDIELLEKAINKSGKRCVVYYGETSEPMRKLAINDFRNGDADVFLATPAAAGEGITLTEAKTVIYYNNSFRLDERLQSEDRAHRIGQDQSVQYIDLICPGTIDEYIVRALREKIDIASTITGDQLAAWVR